MITVESNYKGVVIAVERSGDGWHFIITNSEGRVTSAEAWPRLAACINAAEELIDINPNKERGMVQCL